MEQLAANGTLLYLLSILRKTTVYLLYHLFLRITCIPWNFAEFQISHESADIRWFTSKWVVQDDLLHLQVTHFEAFFESFHSLRLQYDRSWWWNSLKRMKMILRA